MFVHRVINTEFKGTQHILISFYLGPVLVCLFFGCLETAKFELNLFPSPATLTYLRSWPTGIPVLLFMFPTQKLSQ